MDLKTFAADDFDTKKWINNAWRSSGNQDKEVFVANTVSRLQLYMKQLTNSLDETTTQIITSVPRVLQDASTLQLEGSMLQQQLFQLEQKLVGVQRETGHSIESLQRIDRLKSRLESASSALAEGDKWAALAASLGDTLDAGVPAESERLRALTAQASALAASLEVLTDTPDYEQRKLQLETLFTKLEAAVSAPFLSALSKMDTERTEAYAAMLRAMHRSPSVARCARRSFSELVRAQWTRGEAHTTLALARSVAGQLGAQVEWLTDVLKCETPLKELFELYTDLLPTLEPSPSKVVTAALKHCSTPQEGILYLTDVRQDLDLLLNAFRTLLESPKTKETMPQATIKQLGRAVYAPLRELMPAYLELQVQVFNGYLETAELDQTDNLESARAIQALVDRCEDWLSNAHNAARKIAGNAVYPYFMPAVEHIGTSISAALERTAQRIHSAHAAGAVTSRGLWGVFPAAAALSHSAAAMADVLAAVVTRMDQEMDAENTPTQCPLDSLATLLQTDGTSHKQDSLSAAILRLRKAKRTSTALSISLLATPTTVQIAKVPTLDVWSNNDALSTDLPDFAISPQEYITEVGQYLMTLPQHLEMHLPEKQAWELLNEICNQTCEMYAEKILNIRNMDELGTKRCLTDIVYLSSVVEDLGSTITPSLTNLEKSLRAATPAPTSD